MWLPWRSKEDPEPKPSEFRYEQTIAEITWRDGETTTESFHIHEKTCNTLRLYDFRGEFDDQYYLELDPSKYYGPDFCLVDVIPLSAIKRFNITGERERVVKRGEV